MNKLLPIILFLISLYGCETDHTTRKLIVNNSSYTFQLDYNNYWPTDSILNFYPGDYKYILETHKLGNHPSKLPYPPCSMHSDDTITVLIANYTFIGDFKDEYRWDENTSGKRSTIQQCSFTITDDDFQ